ncbi:MAG: hypothetical protein ACTSWX_07610 [Promethearchaeota archaeon]
MTKEEVNEKSPGNAKLKEKINKTLKDSLKFYGFSFAIFSILTLIFFFAGVPDLLIFGSFIIAVFTGIMFWNHVKFKKRCYNCQ